MSRFVRQRTNDVLAVEDAALYQALHRLEPASWVAASGASPKNNRRAQYYKLTPLGRRQLPQRGQCVAVAEVRGSGLQGHRDRLRSERYLIH